MEEFALEQDGRTRAGGDLVEFHERRAADGFDNVVVDASHKSSCWWLIRVASEILAKSAWRASLKSAASARRN